MAPLTTDAGEPVLFLGRAAAEIGVPYWKLDAAIRRKLIPEPRKVGRYRVVLRQDLPTIAEALRACGYLADCPALATA